MLKITNLQLKALEEIDYRDLSETIAQQWQETTASLYRDHPPLMEKDVNRWIQQVIDVCRNSGLDSEQSIICLALNVLSAATLCLPIEFIQGLVQFFIKSGNDSEVNPAAQPWISLVLFQAHEQTLHNRQRSQA